MIRSGQWLTVQLRCARETTLNRSLERGDSDTLKRLAAWDETAGDLARNEAFPFALTLDSDHLSARQSAVMIADALFRQHST
jgi:guanylate kinase